ncbi:spermatozoon-associated protein kinase-like isoform X3 [Physella acuta]|uniref:spermatozoon-associated protein kinase-like isoform X3 n=1 Tax=Physella acuta TaxID=109671 RepID=UPI0027DE7ECF|nr:spermatozoon-associated protein kinase-like isoform X3 [Physella acuta]
MEGNILDFKSGELVLSTSENWLKEYLEKAKKEFDERFKANPSYNESIRNFTLIRTLGSGSFGRVMLAQHNSDSSGKCFAIKILNKEKVVRTKQVDHTINEKRLLGSVGNFPFIIRLVMAFKDTTNLYMVMEFSPGGELFRLIRRKGRIPEAWAQFYSAQVVLALQYLHNATVLYRDLKPENLLIDGTGYLKMADFGFAKRGHQTWTLCGTPQYIAPEMILNKGYGKSVDYWGLGILIYEMVAGYVPFDHKTPIKLYEMIVECNVNYPSHFKPQLSNLLSKLIQIDVTKRYGNLKEGAFDIINHLWYKDVDFRKIITKAYQAPWIPHLKNETDTSNFERSKEESISILKTDKYVEEFIDF